jgi:hypothetical protein
MNAKLSLGEWVDWLRHRKSYVRRKHDPNVTTEIMQIADQTIAELGIAPYRPYSTKEERGIPHRTPHPAK